MGKVKVTVRNTLNFSVKLQEGNAGVFAHKATLRAGDKFTLELDPNATYREYVLIKLPDNTNLEPVFSSDDVIGFKEIRVMEVAGPDPQYYWKGIYKNEIPEKLTSEEDVVAHKNKSGEDLKVTPNPGEGSETTLENPGKGHTTPGAIQKLIKFFRMG